MLILFIILTMVFSSYVIKTSTAEFEEQIDVQLRGITTQIDNTLRLADDIALQIAANYQLLMHSADFRNITMKKTILLKIQMLIIL